MEKQRELDDPNSCFNKGGPNTLKFVLTETDVTAPDAVRSWVALRLAKGRNIPTDMQIVEALGWADKVEKLQQHKPGPH